MNYVGKKTHVTNSYSERILSYIPTTSVKNFVPWFTGADALLNVPAKLMTPYLEKEIDTPNGKNYVKMPLNRTERVGLAIADLLSGGVRMAPWASLVASYGCHADSENRICKTASFINTWELEALKWGKWLAAEGLDHAAPLVKEGYLLILRGMSKESTFIMTHVGLWGTGTYLLRSAYKDYQSSPLSAFHVGKIKIERKSKTASATAWKLAKMTVKTGVAALLIGTSALFVLGKIAPPLEAKPLGPMPPPPKP